MQGLQETSTGGQNVMMILIAEPINGVLTHNGGPKVKEGIGGRGPQGVLGTLKEAHHLQEEAVQIGRANEVCNIHIK